MVDGIDLAMSLRKVGAGIGVLHGWHPWPERLNAQRPHPEPSEFRMQTRDMYVAPRDTSFWQGAIREPDDPDYEGVRQAIEQRENFTINLLYGDHEGGQRTISRFGVLTREGDEGGRLCTVGRHWNLDRADPR